MEILVKRRIEDSRGLIWSILCPLLFRFWRLPFRQ